MRLGALIGLCAAAVAAAAAPASAATLDPLKPCYRSVDPTTRETVHVSARGFTPGAAIDVAIDGMIVATDVRALADGTVQGDVKGPYQPRGQRPFALSLTEHDRPASSASATSRVAALGLELRPARARPSERVRYVGRGFLDGPEVFAHYVLAGRLRKTVSLGAPQGLCGRVRVSRPQIPVADPQTGRWIVQVDNQRRYSRQPDSVFVRVAITVKRVPRGPR